MKFGLPALGYYNKEDRLDDAQPYGLFETYSMNINYVKQLNAHHLGERKLTWQTTLFGQFSNDRLFSGQSVGLGGQSTIRGYKKESIIGASGVYWRNDLSCPLTELRGETLREELGTIDFFLSYDIGATYGAGRADDKKGLIHGVGTGLRLRGGKWNGELSASYPLNAPDFILEYDPVYYASLNYTF